MRWLVLLLLIGCPEAPGPGFVADRDDDDSADDPADDDDSTDDPADDDDSADDPADDDDSADDPADDDDSAGACAGGCDDSDPCTTDVCVDDECTHTTFDGDAYDVFDLPLLVDASTLDLVIVSSQTVTEAIDLLPVSIEVDEIRFTSYEYDGCALTPVRIEAFVAYPTATPAPGLTVAHGLGGNATVGAASGPAAELGVVALAYSGPGQGASEGVGSTADHLFDTVPDPRNSWFYGHAAAAVRATTLLESLPEVDPTRLALTGYSGGAVATLMAGGLDDRLVATLPISGTGHMQLAIDATPQPGWQADLLAAMDPPLDANSQAWANYVAWLDPANFLGTTTAEVLLVNGAQDEFFPLPSTVATFDGLPGDAHRLLSIVNWDHGWFALFNDVQPGLDVADAARFWLTGRLGLDPELAAVPPVPTVDTFTASACPQACTLVTATIPDVDGYVIESATLHFGVDGLAYASWNLQDQGVGVWGAFVGTLDPALLPSLVSFVEVEYGVDFLGLGVPPFFKLSSVPAFPAGFSPTILPIDGPLPLP